MNWSFWWTNNGFNCQMEQARFSNSNFNGSSTTDSPKTKSKGNPSYKSDASKEPSAMVSSSPATGNPLNTTNYSQGYKWGNTYQDKWQNIATRPDEQEKSHTYEGE